LSWGVASGLTLLVGGSCTSSNPAQVDLSTAADMSMTMTTYDLSVPPDLATTPPDLAMSCGFGQVRTAGACACDVAHTTICSGMAYCCGSTQTCLPTAGPRGETRCSGPSVRAAIAMGYDPARANIILRGGQCQDGQMNPILCTDQWTLGQTTWDIQTPSTAITPRYGAVLTWLPFKQQLALFGGLTAQGNFSSQVNEMYTWSGTDWSKVAPAGSVPAARAFTAMAYDPNRFVTVLYGGSGTGDNSLGDTWEFSDMTTSWKQLTPSTDPQVRESHGIVYDPTLKKVVMHAGYAGGVLSRDVWTYDGNDWTKLPDNAAIPVRANFAWALDTTRGVSVLFGGETTNGATLGETWEFSGGTFTKKTPATSPPARVFPAMVYDSGRKQMVMFGGNSGANLLKDAWAWDGTTWTQLY
jgi:hypothetical protein